MYATGGTFNGSVPSLVADGSPSAPATERTPAPASNVRGAKASVLYYAEVVVLLGGMLLLGFVILPRLEAVLDKQREIDWKRHEETVRQESTAATLEQSRDRAIKQQAEIIRLNAENLRLAQELNKKLKGE